MTARFIRNRIVIAERSTVVVGFPAPSSGVEALLEKLNARLAHCGIRGEDVGAWVARERIARAVWGEVNK